MSEDSNKDSIPVVVSVIEPDPEIRAEVDSIVATVPDWRQVGPRPRSLSLGSAFALSEPLRLVVLGPGVSVRTVEKEAKKKQITVVLNEPEEVDRRAEAYRFGVHDVLVWPLQRRELVLRLGFLVQRQLERRLRAIDRRDLDALLDLSESLINSTNVEQTLSQISKRMAEVMNSERCSIIILDHRTGKGYVIAASDDASIRQHEIPVEESYPEILEVLRTAAPLVIDDVHRDPIFDGVRDKIRDKPVGHTALFPVLLDGRVEGVLHLRGANVRRRELSKRHIRFGNIIANVVAIVLRNARLYERVRQRAEQVASDRQKAEQKIRDLEKYQRFFDLAGDGIIIVDGNGRILFANPEARQVLGFEAEDITHLGLPDLVALSSRAQLEELLAGIRRGEHRQRLDLSVVRASGEVAVLSLSTGSLDAEMATPSTRAAEVAAIVSLRDVTETRQLESELRQTTKFLENLIESSADAIVAADMRGRIVVFNQTAEEITGFVAEDVIGKMSVASLYDSGVAQRIMGALRSSASGRFHSAREDLLTSTGQRVPISLRAALLYDGDREIASVGIFSDLRAQLEMEARLEDAQKKLQVSERQAGALEVAGTAAHELSQPLTAIVGSAEIAIRKIAADSPARRSVERILSESERMTEILKKIGQLTQYKTKPYLGDTNIVDLDASTGAEEDPK